MPNTPDDSELDAAGELSDDPEADTEDMPPPPPPTGTKSEAKKLSDLLPAAFERMRRRHTGQESPIPLPAWPTMAEKLGGGLWPGLHVLVGNTAAGKTQFALQLAIHAAQAGTPVLYIALEAGDVEFIARCLGLVADVHWSPLYQGRGDHLETLIKNYAPALEELRLHVLLAPPHGWPAGALEAEVQAHRQRYPETTPGDTPLLVILDFLQIVGTTNEREDLRERIGRAAYIGRGVAREHNAAVLLASSTARENYLALTGRKRNAKKGGAVEVEAEKLGQGNPSRLVGLGKESGEIEFAADTVLVLTQEPWENNTPPKGGTVCHLALAKVRAGVPAWVALRFDGRAFTEPAPETRTTFEI